ncbi:MAG: peptidylprolyl isomerase [Pirellulales bacterium]
MSRRHRTRHPRTLHLEQLDLRYLLAADLAGPTWLEPAPVLLAEAPAISELVSAVEVGEGEDQATATDLMALARAIAATGTKFYGAAWCPFCTQQKELFNDAQYYLPFVEATNPDRTLNAAGQAANITSFPTWIFPDGSREVGVQTLETLAQRAGVTITQSNVPELLPLADLTVLGGSPRWIALDGFDPNLDRLTYTVTTDNPGLLSLQVPEGNRSLLVDVKSWGKMTFQLFDHLVPQITERIANQAAVGFYDKTATNNSIVSEVVQTGDVQYIQLGDPSGNGTGSSGLGPVNDQFDTRLQYNAAGYLGLVKSGDDSGDVQFFVTDGPARALDFDYPIFGFLTEGEKVRDAINGTATSNDRPVRDIIINSIDVVADNENAALLISAAEGASGTANVTVTVADPFGHTAQRTFRVTVQPDTANGGPFLRPGHTQVTAVGQAVSWPLGAIDVEGDPVQYEASLIGTSGAQVSVDANTGRVTVTPPAGFTGSLQVLTKVRHAPSAANDTADPFDTQVVSVLVQANPLLWQNPDSPLDTDGNQTLAPRDALIVINELNFRQFTNNSGQFIVARPDVGFDFLFYDTSGDNLVTPRDALLVINELNNPQGGAAGEAEGEGAAVESVSGDAGESVSPSMTDAALAAYLADDSATWSRLRRQATA